MVVLSSAAGEEAREHQAVEADLARLGLHVGADPVRAVQQGHDDLGEVIELRLRGLALLAGQAMTDLGANELGEIDGVGEPGKAARGVRGLAAQEADQVTGSWRSELDSGTLLDDRACTAAAR